jgi:hypothetical protein
MAESDTASSTNHRAIFRAREVFDALHKARQAGRTVEALFLLEPMPRNAARLHNLAACGLLALETPLGGGYDLRGLYGLHVWLWSVGPKSTWTPEILPAVRQARPASLRLTYHGIAWEVIPLEAPVETEQTVPSAPPPSDFRTDVNPHIQDLYARLGRGETTTSDTRPWWEEPE